MYGQFDAREIPSTNIATETIQPHSPAQRHLQNNKYHHILVQLAYIHRSIITNEKHSINWLIN